MMNAKDDSIIWTGDDGNSDRVREMRRNRTNKSIMIQSLKNYENPIHPWVIDLSPQNTTHYTELGISNPLLGFLAKNCPFRLFSFVLDRLVMSKESNKKARASKARTGDKEIDILFFSIELEEDMKEERKKKTIRLLRSLGVLIAKGVSAFH